MRGWPATLEHGALRLRPLCVRDARAWSEVQSRNVAWLSPWEATLPYGHVRPSFGARVRWLRRQARNSQALPFALDVDGQFRGQLTVASMVWGSLCSGTVGYWIDQEVAGRGYMPCAVAMVIDHCLAVVGLHRLEINIRPENAASLAVVRKLGLRDEGLRARLLHIDGAWADHRSFAVTVEELAGGVHARFHTRQQQVTTP